MREGRREGQDTGGTGTEYGSRKSSVSSIGGRRGASEESREEQPVSQSEFSVSGFRGSLILSSPKEFVCLLALLKDAPHIGQRSTRSSTLQILSTLELLECVLLHCGRRSFVPPPSLHGDSPR